MAAAKSLLLAASRSRAPKVKSKPITRAPALASRSMSGTYSRRGQAGGPKRAMLFSSMPTITTCGLGLSVPRSECQASRSTRSGRRMNGATSAPKRSTTRTATAMATRPRRWRRAITASSKSLLPSSLMGKSGAYASRALLVESARRPRPRPQASHERPRGGAVRAGASARMLFMLDAMRRLLEADERVAYALVFGSSARGTTHAESDVDVALGLVGPTRLTALELGDIASKLEAAAGRRVDLVLIDEAPPGLAYRVFRDGRLFFERDRKALVERKARAILEYLDFQPVEDLLARGALAAASRGR